MWCRRITAHLRSWALRWPGAAPGALDVAGAVGRGRRGRGRGAGGGRGRRRGRRRRGRGRGRARGGSRRGRGRGALAAPLGTLENASTLTVPTTWSSGLTPPSDVRVALVERQVHRRGREQAPADHRLVLLVHGHLAVQPVEEVIDVEERAGDAHLELRGADRPVVAELVGLDGGQLDVGPIGQPLELHHHARRLDVLRHGLGQPQPLGHQPRVALGLRGGARERVLEGVRSPARSGPARPSGRSGRPWPA